MNRISYSNLLLEGLYFSVAISFSLLKLGMKRSQFSSELTLLSLKTAQRLNQLMQTCL